MLVTEDLHVGYYEGFHCVDASAADSQQSNFMCKVVLLLLAGDYPALAKATGFTHSGACHCHWCHQTSPKDMAVNRHATGNFRRWLTPGSVHRAAGGNFRHVETGGPPRYRTHSDVVRTGVQARNWTGTQKLHPRHTAGICDWNPLSALPYFCLVWDVIGDFMHLVLWYPRHILTALNGQLPLARPRLLTLTKNNEPFENGEFRRRQQKNQQMERDNKIARKVKSSCTVSRLGTCIILDFLGIIPYNWV